jgi:hypothetical protein
MLALGIEDDELLLKTEDDFSSKGITPDVRHLRFAFFSRKQQELLRQIKTFMKEEYIRFNEQKSRISDSDHDQSFSGQDMFNELISKTKQKNQEIIQKHLSSVQNNFSEIKAIEARLQNGQKIRENLKSSVTKQRMKMMEFKQKQLENLEKYSKSPIRVKSSNRKHDLSPAKFVRRRDLSPKARFNHDDFLNEEETIKKIQGFEEKMEKSKELSESFIQSKKEAISKLLEKSSKSHQKTSNDLEYNEKLLKIVEKANQADIRRGNLLKIQTERRIKQKEIEEQRRSKTRSKLNENRKDLEKKNKDIEEKMRRSEYVLEKKQEKWMKELEIRNELQRLRDEETLLNAERKKRAS